jgi:hypothetical protein
VSPGAVKSACGGRQLRPHSVPCQPVGDARVDRSRPRHVLAATGLIAAPELRDAAAEERSGVPRLRAQHAVEVGNRRLDIPEAQVHQAAAVEGVRVSWSQSKGFVAVPQGVGELSQHETAPAAVAEGQEMLRIDLERLAEVGLGALVVVP